MPTAVILAGGNSNRMGRDKLTLEFCGRSLLEGAVKRFERLFDRVVVSVGDVSKYGGIEAEKVGDIYPGCVPCPACTPPCPYRGRRFSRGGRHALATPEAALRLIELCGQSDVCAPVDVRAGSSLFLPITE